MNQIVEAVRAVLAAIGRMVGRFVSVTKFVGGKLVTTTETVFERVFDAVVSAPRTAVDLLGATSKLAIGAVSDVVKAPFRLAGMLLNGRKPQQPGPAAAQNEAAAQQQAAQQEDLRQALADRQSEARELVQAVRSVAAARGKGERLDDVTLARLPEEVREYLLGLTQSECDVVAAASVPGLRGVLKGKPPEGVRSPEDLKKTAGADVITEEQVAARRAEVRSAARAAMRGQPKTEDADAIMRTLQV